MKKYFAYITTCCTLFAAACGDGGPVNKGNGPIRLGDSSTIITEKDSQYLKDEVMDVVPSRRILPDNTAVTQEKEKPVPAGETPLNPPRETVAGYTITFGGSKLVIAGLQVKEGARQHPETDNSLRYGLRSGDPGSARLYVYGAGKVTLKQRYQSRLVLRSSLGTVDLRELGLYTSGWNTISAAASGGASVFDLRTLNDISYAQVNNAKIRNAADRELRKRRAGSRVIRNWMKEIKGIRNVHDKPCDIILDNVQWQISGTDARGKAFQKTIRLDT